MYATTATTAPGKAIVCGLLTVREICSASLSYVGLAYEFKYPRVSLRLERYERTIFLFPHNLQVSRIVRAFLCTAKPAQQLHLRPDAVSVTIGPFSPRKFLKSEGSPIFIIAKHSVPWCTAVFEFQQATCFCGARVRRMQHQNLWLFYVALSFFLFLSTTFSFFAAHII